jgi:hypothetical protein
MSSIAMPSNSTAYGLPRGQAKEAGFKDPDDLVKKARTKSLVLDVLCVNCSCAVSFA